MRRPFGRSKPAAKNNRPKPAAKRSWRSRLLRLLLWVFLLGYGWVAGTLLLFRWVQPPTTAVRLQRRVEAAFRPGTYREQWRPVPLARISPHLQHAVLAAEDGNFYRHWGFDFEQLEIAVKEDLLEEGRLRGASTLTQQLVKNIYLTTRGSFVRKGIEATLVPFAEGLLGKDRILEIYLNQAEWGPGVFGAEAAAQFHYRTSAARLTREQAARLAAILPSPLRRRPARMNRYSAIILQRMQAYGW